MRRLVFITIVLLVSAPAVFAQSASQKDSLFTKAISLFDEEQHLKSYDVFSQFQQACINEQDTANIPFALSFIYQGEIGYTILKAQSDSFVNPLKRAMMLCEKYGHKTTKVSLIGAYLGYHFEYHASDLEAAKDIYQQAILSYPKDSTPNRMLIYCHKGLGTVYSRKGDFEQAVSYYQRGIALREAHKEDLSLYGLGLRNDMAVSYKFQGRFDEARATYLEVYNDRRIKDTQKAYILMGLAEAFLEDSLIDKARLYARKVIDLGMLNHNGDSLNMTVVNGLSLLGDIESAKGNLQGAIDWQKKAIALCSDSRLYGPRHRVIGKAYYPIAENYKLLGNDSLALDAYQHALLNFIPYFTPGNIYELPKIKLEDKEIWIVTILRLKADLFLKKYAETSDIELAKHAQSHIQLAISQQEKVVFDLSSRESNARIIEVDYPIYQCGIEACYALYEETGHDQYLAAATQIMEQGKAMLLRKNAAVGNLSMAPAIQGRIDSIEQLISQIRIKESTRKQQGKIAQLNVEADLLRSQGREDPALNAYLLRQSATELFASLQQKVHRSPGHGILHYFVSDSMIYTLFIHAQGTQFSKATLGEELLPTIDHFRKSLSQPPSTESAEKAFALMVREGHYLYKSLLKPFLDQQPTVTQLTIIPHGPLNAIPFESLLTDSARQATSYQDLPYLLKTHTISYAYSAASLLDETNHMIQPGALALAPVFTGETRGAVDTVRGNLANLEWTNEEAKEVNAIHGGQLLLGEVASERFFKETYQQSGIIHIASHALLHEIEPTLSRILFSEEDSSGEDGSLFLEEIFQMDFSDKLVCLSACNTAWGKMTRSDGLMSLARGFHYAGSPSLVATMWQAHDRSSYLLSTSFHQEVSEGKTLDEAMQLAKLSYLEKADALKAHPYYWAQMVVIGETELKTKGKGRPNMAITAMLFLLLTGISFWGMYKRP